MLCFELNNQFIPLDPNISIPFVLNNPMFDTKGSYSFSQTFPLTNELEKAIGFIGSPDKKGLPQMPLSGKLYYQGGNSWQVDTYINEVNNENVKINFRIGLGGFYELTKNMMLQDLVLGGERTIVPVTPTTDFNFPEYDYSFFPVNNYTYFTDEIQDTNYKLKIKYQNYPSGAWFVDATPECLTPFPFVGYVLEQIFSENGYDVDDNIFRYDPDLKKLSEFNVYNSTVVTIKKQGSYSTAVSSKVFLKNHLPGISIDEYITNIQNKYNIRFFVNEFNKKVKILKGKNIIVNPGYIDISTIVSKTNTCLNDFVYDGFVLKMERDSNDDNINNYYSDVSEFQHLIKGSVALLSDLDDVYIQVGDVYFVEENSAYYQMQNVDEPFPWKLVFLTYNSFQDYYSQYNGNLLEIQSGISTVKDLIHTDLRTERNWKTPWLFQPGNSGLGSLDNEFGHRHIFYHGLSKDSENNDYPFGSSDNYNYAGTKVGDLSLSYKGDYGIYNQLWKEWLNWQLNIAKTFKRKILFDDYLLFNFPWEKKFRIRNTNYFVKQIKVNLKYKAPEVGVSEIVKC